MELGMVGLGRMGSSLVRRLMRDGHTVVVHDVNPATVAELVADGAIGASDLEDLAARLSGPRSVWVMVPAAITGRVIEDVAAYLEPGDIVVDGGNSFYQDDQHRSAALAERGIRLVDAGTSGGIFGLDRGFCLMIGGDTDAVAHLEPAFRTLAPGFESATRSPGRAGPPATEELGYLHCGPSGAGHFTKMVHNGIEYGIMAAYAEGLNILKHADAGVGDQMADAETAPMRDPEHFRYSLDLPAITQVWRRGSVIASWLLDLTAAALDRSPELSEYSGMVSDSGEGRWTVLSAVQEGVPAPVLSAALYARFDSRGRDAFANQVLSAMRHQFGGHAERTEAP